MQWQWQQPEGSWVAFPPEHQQILSSASASGHKIATLQVDQHANCQANLVEGWINVGGVSFHIRQVQGAEVTQNIALPTAATSAHASAQQQGHSSPSSGRIRSAGNWVAGKIDGAATYVEQGIQARTDRKLENNPRDPNAQDTAVPGVVQATGKGLVAASGGLAYVAEGVAGAVGKAGQVIGKAVAPISGQDGILTQTCEAYVNISDAAKGGAKKIIKAGADGAERRAQNAHGDQVGEFVGDLGETAGNVGKTAFAVNEVMQPVKGVAKGVVRGVQGQAQQEGEQPNQPAPGSGGVA
eukprot:TRINITY_DN12090_c0_g2_i1.p2 TRINITY_DN12090_c0_g2~~TRINITY_DN12090_c0_g2_i1.p2  ORF type:complete len:307 (+),score=43.95 TRINITY_DN12090_c0_g2_i1:31-921(+)